MQDIRSEVGDDVSDEGWVRASSTSSSLPVTRNMQDLSIEKDWDRLSSASASHDSVDIRLPAQQHHVGAFELNAGRTGNGARQAPFDITVLEDWRRVTGAVSPMRGSESEAGVSEISIVSSNAFDPVFFPERNATPTNKKPQRECSTRHGVLCQLCSEEIRGMRWMCKECPQWSVCTECFVVTAEHEVHPVHTFIRIFSPTDIFKVQEQPSDPMPILGKPKDFIAQPTIHLDVECHNCKGSIIGSRYDCAAEYCFKNSISFCQDCEALPINCHPPDHPLIKYKLSKETSRPIFTGDDDDDNIVRNTKGQGFKAYDVAAAKLVKRHMMNRIESEDSDRKQVTETPRANGSSHLKLIMEDHIRRESSRKHDLYANDETPIDMFQAAEVSTQPIKRHMANELSEITLPDLEEFDRMWESDKKWLAGTSDAVRKMEDRDQEEDSRKHQLYADDEVSIGKGKLIWQDKSFEDDTIQAPKPTKRHMTDRLSRATLPDLEDFEVKRTWAPGSSSAKWMMEDQVQGQYSREHNPDEESPWTEAFFSAGGG